MVLTNNWLDLAVDPDPDHQQIIQSGSRILQMIFTGWQQFKVAPEESDTASNMMKQVGGACDGTCNEFRVLDRPVSSHCEFRVLLEGSFSCQQAVVCSKFIDLTTTAASQRRSVDATKPS